MPTRTSETDTDGVMMALGYDADLQAFDLVTVSDRLARDGAFETCVYVSLFTNRRDPRDPTNAIGGWWGNDYPDVPGDEVGSLLWTLEGKRIDASALRDARVFTMQAMAWAVDDGVAAKVEAVAEPYGPDSIAIGLWIYRPDGSRRWFGTWDLTGKKLTDAP